jgi:glycosyltransferase involved in cell wall biosynthesis
VVTVGVLPRDPNPYQENLHDELRRLGFSIVYLDGLTRSRTLNLLLQPLELVRQRRRGLRVIHLHWVFGFGLPWAPGRLGRTLSQLLFWIFLRTCSILDLPLIWTAHNVLPHAPVFLDDPRARRWLIRSAAAVIVHNQETAERLRSLGATRTVVIPEGVRPVDWSLAPSKAEARDRLELPDGPICLFFGSILPYKGVDNLIRAALGFAGRLTTVVCGASRDAAYLSDIRRLADGSSAVVLRLERVPDRLVSTYFQAADFVCLPFREITNSGSALLALSMRRPLLIPDLPELGDLPPESCVRYPNSQDGLRSALAEVLDMAEGERDAVAQRGWEWTLSRSWFHSAEATAALYRGVAASGPGTG